MSNSIGSDDINETVIDSIMEKIQSLGEGNVDILEDNVKVNNSRSEMEFSTPWARDRCGCM